MDGCRTWRQPPKTEEAPAGFDNPPEGPQATTSEYEFSLVQPLSQDVVIVALV